MKTTLLTLATFGALISLASADIKTQFEKVSDFTDFSISGGRESQAQAVFNHELRRHGRLQTFVGKHRVLELTFTDIDMAGDTEPWRFRSGGGNDVRIIRGVYPPRLTFSYVLKDAGGKTIASGEEKLSDVGFQFGSHSGRNRDNFHYELEMLEDWARKALPKA